MFHTTVFGFFFPFSQPHIILRYDGAQALTIPSSTDEHRPLRSGLFSPTSSMPLGCSWSWPPCGKAGSLGWTGRGLCEGFPTSGSSLPGVPPAPPFLQGQTVLEGHNFWRQWETGFVFLQVSGILLHSQLLWAFKFSQKSPCKSHQITQREVFGGMGLR